MTKPTCATCRFWRKDEECNFGDCRRSPPRIVDDALVADSCNGWDREAITTHSHFPSTYGDEWCGEWQPQAVSAEASESRWREFFGGLSVRVRNVLDAEHVGSFADLDALRDDQLLSIRNFGRSSLREVRARRDLFPKVSP
jgi:hypothetical protein